MIPLRLMANHVLGSGQENSLVRFCFVKGWLSKDLNPEVERNKVENPVEFTERVREQEFIVDLQITTVFEMSRPDSCVSGKMKTQQDLATQLLCFGQCTGH